MTRSRQIPRPTDRPDWLDPGSWPFPVRRLEGPVGPLSVTETGAGPTLLFVHTGFWSFVWRDVIAGLDDRFRCVAPDAPGTGASGRPPRAEITLDTASSAIGRVMDDLDTELTLVVHDLGGPPAFDAAATRAGQVTGIVAVNSFAWRPSGAAFRSMLAVMGSAPMRELDAWTGFLPRMSSTRFGVGRAFDRSERKVFRRGIDRSARRSFHRYMASARRSPELFDRIEAATAGPLRDRDLLTIFGERNDPLRFQPRWRERFPGARQVVVPKGMHFPMCDDPGLVASSISAWHETTRLAVLDR